MWLLQFEKPVERDPSRLLQPTASMKHRASAEADPERLFAERPAMWARATPGWCKGR